MELAVVFLPALAALIVGAFGRTLGDRASQVITSGAVCLAALLAVILFIDVGLVGHADGEAARRTQMVIATFMNVGDFQVDWAIRVDAMSVTMMMVVTLVSALVHIYSIGYMSHDPDKPRFMAYLSLFTFAMLALVTADNLIQMFFGWEGVGLASYLLIGFWYKKPSASSAAIKAFVVNRVGDFGYALGIMTLFAIFGSVEFATILNPEVVAAHADTTFSFLGFEVHGLTLAALLLFMGAMGKSAQLGLHTWLPDAMEGPTPVSALIHAATMVTAGVFMLCRMSPVLEYAPTALEVITVFGALTAFVAATIGLTQHDIKRVIAYSTMSQLGYMVFAVGVSAYEVAMFHLTTHAFFKALLFLGAGSVIHALHDEQDMRRMGGMAKHIKWTFWAMMVGSIALAGLPPLAGFFSKDAILAAAYGASDAAAHGFDFFHTHRFGEVAYWLGVAAAFMTAFYSFRLIFMTFYGEERASKETMAHVHESPPVMLVPLGVLSVLSVVAGLLLAGPMIGKGAPAFWGDSLFALPEQDIVGLMNGSNPLLAEAAHGEDHGAEEAAHAAYHVSFIIHYLGVILAVVGIGLAWYLFVRNPHLPGQMTGPIQPLYQLVHRKWYFDELYDFLFVDPAPRLGRILWRRGDRGTIDYLGPDGVSLVTRLAALRSRAIQSGFLYHYAFASVAGLVVLLTWYLYRFQS